MKFVSSTRLVIPTMKKPKEEELSIRKNILWYSEC
jgi:hypothetical protein